MSSKQMLICYALLVIRDMQIKPQYMNVLVTHTYPTLWDPMDCSPPGSSVHGVLQARVLEWVTIPSSRGSLQPSPVHLETEETKHLWACGAAGASCPMLMTCVLWLSHSPGCTLYEPEDMCSDVPQTRNVHNCLQLETAEVSFNNRMIETG